MAYYTESDDFDGPEEFAKVLAVLTAGHLDTYGGYPYDWVECGDMVFVASLDDGKDRNRTQIDEYRREELIAWEKRAHQYREEFPESDWVEAVWETMETQ